MNLNFSVSAGVPPTPLIPGAVFRSTASDPSLGSQHDGSCLPGLISRDTVTRTAANGTRSQATAQSGDAGSNPAESTSLAVGVAQPGRAPERAFVEGLAVTTPDKAMVPYQGRPWVRIPPPAASCSDCTEGGYHSIRCVNYGYCRQWICEGHRVTADGDIWCFQCVGEWVPEELALAKALEVAN